MANDRLKISGTVERAPPKFEHTEEWEAIPLTGQDGQVAPWRVEITTDSRKEVILVLIECRSSVGRARDRRHRHEVPS